MTYVKILESELNELISLKDEYHTNCIKLYNDIQNRDRIIEKIQAECMAACKERDDIITFFINFSSFLNKKLIKMTKK